MKEGLPSNPAADKTITSYFPPTGEARTLCFPEALSLWDMAGFPKAAEKYVSFPLTNA